MVEIIEKYINGNADENEKKYVESLFLNGENNLYLRSNLRKDWETMLQGASSIDTDLSHLLSEICHKIMKYEAKKRKKPLRRILKIYMKVAAILVLPLLIAGGLVFSYLFNLGKVSTDQQANYTITAPLGSRVSFNLPDSSSGMLNSGSQLSYSLPFTKNIILEGEAWLDVKHDKNHPFKINAGKSLIEVLGTSLNLSAYPEENYIEIVLLEGNVEFLNIKEGEKISLLPSERLVYKDGNISKSFVDPQKYKAWTSGKMVFKNDPMLEVARRIERWYNVKVELADPELMKYTFRATFEDDKLENVMKFLCMTSPFKYKITPSELSSDGTFKKEKVTIYLNKSHI